MIRIGLAGTGLMAATMLPALEATSGVQVVAVASHSLQRSRLFGQTYGIADAYGSLEPMLEDGSIDAIYVANRTVDHAKTSIAALTAGKAVLCEKPFAVTAQEGENVLLAARESRQLFMEGMWTHMLPSHRRFIALAHSGEFGEPRHLYCDFGYPTDASTLPRLFSPQGGGVLLDRGGYLISLALDLLGPVKNVDAALLMSDAGVDLHASLQLLHESGGHSQLSMSLVTLLSNSAIAACPEGIMRLAAPLVGSETITVQRMTTTPGRTAHTMAPSHKQRLMARLKRSSMLRRLKRSLSAERAEYHSYGINPYVSMLEHFRDLILNGRSESDLMPPTLSLETIRIIELGRATDKKLTCRNSS